MARIEDIGYGVIFHPQESGTPFNITYYREKIKQFKSKFEGYTFESEEEWQKEWDSFEPKEDWQL